MTPEYEANLLIVLEALWETGGDAEKIKALLPPVTTDEALRGMSKMAADIRQMRRVAA